MATRAQAKGSGKTKRKKTPLSKATKRKKPKAASKNKTIRKPVKVRLRIISPNKAAPATKVAVTLRPAMANDLSSFSEQERQLIEVLREWASDDEYRHEIERSSGAWEIKLSSPRNGPRQEKWARGVGGTFNEAWDNVERSWP